MALDTVGGWDGGNESHPKVECGRLSSIQSAAQSSKLHKDASEPNNAERQMVHSKSR